jgi:hypothetical protein
VTSLADRQCITISTLFVGTDLDGDQLGTPLVWVLIAFRLLADVVLPHRGAQSS